MLSNIKISKELLSEVLGINSILMGPILEPENKIGYLVYGSQNTLQEIRSNHKQINIYELAHKCKEWAFKQGYSYLGNKGLINIYSKTETIVAIMDENVVNWFDVYIDFKACEWILKETNAK